MQSLSERRERAYARGRSAGRVMAAAAGRASYWDDLARGVAVQLAWPEAELRRVVRAFHAERVAAVPSWTTYPELADAPELLAERYRGMAEAGVSPDTIALSESLNIWRSIRLYPATGRILEVVPTPERCRILYVPASDRGALHAKNVDDPLTYWRPRPAYTPDSAWPWPHPLWFDGVGSGLHIDEVPPEIFPVDVREVCMDFCTTLDAARELLVRYNYFWSSQNLLVHDLHGNSLAFEKTRCRVAVRGPNAQGLNFISGMGALDPGIRAFQTEMREKYLKLRGWTWDSPDGAFWKVCQGKWDNMARYVAELSANPTYDGVMRLMEQRDPSGPMCLTGQRSHPGQKEVGCTLVMDIWEVDRRRLHRRQWRGTTPAYLDTPEIVEFAA